MLKRICAALFLMISALAFGQGACYPAGVVLLDTGRPANGASVRVCTAGSTGTPCTPGASLFTDPTLGTPLVGSPVVTTDAHGNFGFCASAGANYDLQISGTGISTLNIKNLPLPPTSPIVAASLTSSSANPANVGVIKLASGDGIDWRNAANSGNNQLVKSGAASGTLPADFLDWTGFGGGRGVLISPNSNPASAGLVRAVSGDCQKSRNAANSADINTLCTDSNDKVVVGDANGIKATSRLELVEAAAPGGVASSDLLYADSTTHRVKVNNNNGGAKTLANTDGDTLTNTTLTAPSISDPTITGTALAKRIRFNQGSSIVTGDVGSLTGFGNTATVFSAAGSDSGGVIAISSSGTGQAANATFVLTFHDGTWTQSPICVVTRNDVIAPAGSAYVNAASATTVTLGIVGTPVAGSIYSFEFICQGRP
jgi:hypothetical protein